MALAVIFVDENYIFTWDLCYDIVICRLEHRCPLVTVYYTVLCKHKLCLPLCVRVRVVLSEWKRLYLVRLGLVVWPGCDLRWTWNRIWMDVEVSFADVRDHGTIDDQSLNMNLWWMHGILIRYICALIGALIFTYCMWISLLNILILNCGHLLNTCNVAVVILILTELALGTLYAPS